MGKTPTLTERKRAAIIDAALEEFRDKGFQATSMDSLSARAGVSKRTVYNHFESKEALFKEITQQIYDYAVEMTRISYKADRSLASQLDEIAHNELKLLRSEKFRDMAKIILAEFIRQPSLAAEVWEQMEQQENGLNAWISAAIADGKLKEVDPNYAAGIFTGLIKAVTFYPQLLMGQPFPDDDCCQQIAEDAVAMFLARYEIR